jgi:hypothetical protein
LLGLGRCSHWVDPSLPEDKKEEKLAELSEKDPEIERLKAISEEKCIFFLKKNNLEFFFFILFLI